MDQHIIRDSIDIRRSVARRKGPSPKLVMVIDDDDLFREATALVLEKHGYRVEPCRDALEALTRLQRGAAPDVILLDLLMPDMDGWEFRVQQQREPKWASIPVVALSADGSARAAAIHANAFLPKPVEDKQLIATLRKLLDRRAQEPSQTDQALSWPSLLEPLITELAQELSEPLAFMVGNLELTRSTARELEGRLRGPEAFSMVGLSQMLTRTQRGAERIAWTLRSISTRSAAGARKAARKAARGARSSRARVMIVDDEPMVCDALAALLARDYDVATFTDPHAALASMLGGSYDIILCDLMMHELSGMDIHERLAAQRPELARRVIFLSAGVFTERARNFLATTRRAQLHKPVSRDELVEMIEAHLVPQH